MNNYVTGQTIRRLRERRGMTQTALAEKLLVSDKTISKWETGRGFPDISLLEPLAAVLQISLPELFSGEEIVNRNRGANLLRTSLYVCPICGNIIHAAGEAAISCCGVALPPLEAEEPDEAHQLAGEWDGDELYLTLDHPMDKQHFISFMALSTTLGRFELVKLYPEGSAEARFAVRGSGTVYWYCSHHGLFSQRIIRGRLLSEK